MGLRSGLSNLGPPRRGVADLATPIQLAPAAQQPKSKSAHQPPRSYRGQPVEAQQLVLQARRWMPERPLVLVADSGFAALELLAALVRHGVICVTRLRLDAALYKPAPPHRPGTIGRPRTKGARLPSLAEVLTDTAH